MRVLLAALILAVGIPMFVSQVHSDEAVIGDGCKVTFDYVLTVDGKVAETSQTKGPLEYTQGENTLLPGLTKKMVGMKVGEEKVIDLKAEEAYGNPDPAGVREMPMTSVPPDIKPQVGMILQMQDEAGQLFPARITEVKQNSIVIDLNHPLAGKALNFKVRIISIK